MFPRKTVDVLVALLNIQAKVHFKSFLLKSFMPWNYMALFLELLNSILLEPVPHNPYVIATKSKIGWSLFPMVLLSFHQPVSSLAITAILLLTHLTHPWNMKMSAY